MTIRPFKLPRRVLLPLRLSLALIFMMMGSWKVGANEYHMGGRVGELFTFMETTGIWWDLIGATQIAGGLLLLGSRTTTFAALLLLGVTLNIAAVNIALWPAFGTTVWLTAYAFVALVLLLLHDLEKWQYIFWREAPRLREPHDDISPGHQETGRSSVAPMPRAGDPGGR